MEDEVWAVETLGWLPLASLIIFIAAFSIGYGPIPWLMMGKTGYSLVLDVSKKRHLYFSVLNVVDWLERFILHVFAHSHLLFTLIVLEKSYFFIYVFFSPL